MIILAVFTGLVLTGGTLGGETANPGIYVPYKDLSAVIDPTAKAVLMDRSAFDKLLTEVRAQGDTADKDLGFISRAEYTGQVTGEKLAFSGFLTVKSLGKRAAIVPLEFGRIGLTRVDLNGKPAPLGYDEQGKMVLIVEGGGEHQLTVTGSTALKELPQGGMQFNLNLPTCPSGKMKLAVTGDMTIQANVPVTAPVYEKTADQTSVELTVGGFNSLMVTLMGNGRQEGERPILLANSTLKIQLTGSSQIMDCSCTAQILHRSLRELSFALPREWTITQVNCPDLARWNVENIKGSGLQTLVMQLRSPRQGGLNLHVEAAAPWNDKGSWQSPVFNLVGANFQRGYLLVNDDKGLKVRDEKLNDGRREDIAASASEAGIPPNSSGRLYYLWGDRSQVQLDLARVEGRTSSDDRQTLQITPEQLVLEGRFRITAIGEELFNTSFLLPGEDSGWILDSVMVNDQTSGFEYHVETLAKQRKLKIEFARPLPPEGLMNIRIVLRNLPRDWDWAGSDRARKITVPLLGSESNAISGLFCVNPKDDLDATEEKVPETLSPVPVGRMSALGLSNDIELAYRYTSAIKGEVLLHVKKREPQVSAEAVGLVSLEPAKLAGDWRITYDISRAGQKTLFLLADKRIGQQITIEPIKHRLASRQLLKPGTIPAPAGYDAWLLNLDEEVKGRVEVKVRYERPLSESGSTVPLIRPARVHQSAEVLAVQAGEELAISLEPKGTTELDTIDLPPLPGPAGRLLAAFRMEGLQTAQGAKAEIKLNTIVHKQYEIPAALAVSAEYQTYLGARGEQRTEAVFQIVNAGMQFLAVKLPPSAQLWSARVGRSQTKPGKDSHGNYLIPLPRTRMAVPVQLVYAWDGSKTLSDGQVEIGPAELPEICVNQRSWKVWAPPGYRITSGQTLMSTSDLAPPGPAYIQAIYAVGGFLGGIKEFSGCCLMPLGRARESSRRSTEASNLRQIGIAMFTYSQDSNGAFPDTLDRLVEKNHATPEALLDQTRHRFEYFRPMEKVDEINPQKVIAWSSLHDGGRNVLFGDSHVEWMRENSLPPPPRQLDSYLGAYAKPMQQQAFPSQKPVITQGGTFKVQGRYTLPVDLLSTGSEREPIRFTGIGKERLRIGLTGETKITTQWYFGFVLIAIFGIGLFKMSLRRKAFFVFWVCIAASLLAIWRPGLAYFVNGAFFGGLILIPIYIFPVILRKKWFGIGAGTAAPVCMILFFIFPGTFVQAAELPKAPIIIPYEGDPAAAEKSQKVLVPYQQYIELWNRAHPQDPIEMPSSAPFLAIGAANYSVTIGDERLELLLTARIQTFGKGWPVLPLPLSGIAVQEAALDGQAVSLQMGPQGLVLPLHAGVSGTLTLRGITTPKYTGRKGTVELTLPPLPAAVMTIRLPQPDLVLQVTGAEGMVSHQTETGTNQWSVPLGSARTIKLEWFPKIGTGVADRTLSAEVGHNVTFFHWGIVGVSKICYKFSASNYDRFGVLIPAGVRLINIAGVNLRDFRVTEKKVIEGLAFEVVEVRLHRPATERFELELQWVESLPILEKPFTLELPRTADTARESGTVSLLAAEGINVKVDKVNGGRRKTLAESPGNATPETSRKIAEYYWPYRPFSIVLVPAREKADTFAKIDQLIRVTTEGSQLLARVELKARIGKLFGASFILPDGYDVLQVIGPRVEGHYIQPASTGRRLHVNFNPAVDAVGFSIVMVREDSASGRFKVPTVTIINPIDSTPVKQTGRLAVQVAPALEARTAASENLKPVATRTMEGWLDSDQIQAAQYGFEYENPTISLVLDIHPKPTRIRAEILAGLAVQTDSAVYAYRLRYMIDGFPIDHVSFTLPAKYASLVAINSPAMRSFTTEQAGNDRTRWNIALVNEITGTLDIVVNFVLPIDASTRFLEMPRLLPMAPAGIQTLCAVQNFSRHEISMNQPRNLVPLAVTEQKNLLPAQVTQSLQYAGLSFSTDWSLPMNFTPNRGATRVQAVVDLMEITTVIDRAGACRYQVKLSLQNRSEQFLKIQAPDNLKLWSATVAGIAVKPVTGTNEEILIPLVKTSAGGLPYDVLIYFAGDGISQLDGITHLSFPAIRVLSFPVMRTTWSLRLPGGYHYTRWGGNMSPIAGTAEAMNISTEALIDQIRRLEKYESETSSLSSKAFTNSNLGWANSALKSNIKNNEIYIESNRGQIDEDTYGRLKQQIAKQKEYQQVLESDLKKSGPMSPQAPGYDVTRFLNQSTVSRGQSETDRNQALNSIPSFVYGKTGKKYGTTTDIRNQPEKSLEQIGSPREQGKAGMGLAGSRMERFFQEKSLGDRENKGQTIIRSSQDELQKRYPNLNQYIPVNGVPIFQTLAGTQYAPPGTFSLPINLPEGEVQLNFAKPSGDAELTLWALNMGLIIRLLRTGIIAVIILLIWLFMRFLNRLPSGEFRIPRNYVYIYAGGFILLALMAGVIGIFMWFVISLAIEILRRVKQPVADK